MPFATIVYYFSSLSIVRGDEGYFKESWLTRLHGQHLPLIVSSMEYWPYYAKLSSFTVGLTWASLEIVHP